MHDDILPQSARERQQDSPSRFLGYADLSDWAKAAHPLQPVYAMLTTLPRSTSLAGVHIESYYAQVQQLGTDGTIHYWRAFLGSQDYAHGKSLQLDPPTPKQAACQAWEIVIEWLDQAGYETLIAAEFAAPHHYRWLDGGADFLAYDRETRRYSWRTQEVA